MNIDVVSHNYPTLGQPYLQPFIRDQVHVIEKMQGCNVRVMVPSPFVIPFTNRWNNSRSPLLDSHIANRFRYLSIPKRLAPKRTGQNLANKLIKQLKGTSDIVHVHWLYPNGLTVPHLKKAGYSCVLNIHGTDWHSTKNDARFSALIEETFTAADVIVVSGNKIKEEILHEYPNLDVRVSFNYINTEQFPLPDEKLKLQTKDDLAFNTQVFHFLTVANIRPEKGIDVLLEAVSRVDAKDICFHIIGQRGTGSYESLIKDRLKDLPTGLVKIHEPVSPQVISSYYIAADAYLLPSRSEGFNVSLLEALSTGLPVIATNAGGAYKVLENNRGLIVPPNDVDALSNAINTLLNKRPLNRNKFSRTYIENNFSLSHYSSFLEELYSYVYHQKN